MMQSNLRNGAWNTSNMITAGLSLKGCDPLPLVLRGVEYIKCDTAGLRLQGSDPLSSVSRGIEYVGFDDCWAISKWMQPT
jgi:hypothetical protein